MQEWGLRAMAISGACSTNFNGVHLEDSTHRTADDPALAIASTGSPIAENLELFPATRRGC